MNARIERLEGRIFVGLGAAGPFFTSREENWVVPLWKDLFRRADEIAIVADAGRFISPCHAREREFTCYVGVVAAARPERLPGGFVAFEVPAHEYAVGDVHGPRSAIDAVYRDLPAWARAEGRAVDDAILWLEIYPHGPTLDADAPHDYQVWLPLEPRADGPDPAPRAARRLT